MAPLTPASNPSSAEDQAQDMEVDDYAACPSLPSPVSHEDNDLLSGLPQGEVTEVESGLAHLTVSFPRYGCLQYYVEEEEMLTYRMRRDPSS